jgi:hypothetical protein
MSPLKQFGQLAARASLLALVVAAGCSRPNPVSSTAGAQSGQPQAPFNDGEQHPGKGSSREPSAETQDSADSGTGIPFRDPHSLPAGTLLTVRLDKSISADAPEGSGTFAAIVDEPIVIDGVTLIPRGAIAAGRVESARTSAMKRDRGYVRLTLATIDIGGQDFRVQTASLFARANARAGSSIEKTSAGSVIRLDKGRRLTFRLTGPVDVASGQPPPTH